MVDEEFKPGAKCYFHGGCPLYQSGIMGVDTETSLCGRGSPKDPDYIPLIDLSKAEGPFTEDCDCDDFELPYQCPAWKGYTKGLLIDRIETMIDQHFRMHSGKRTFRDLYIETRREI